MSTAVRWAVVPAAGLGTRMLPATKALPKEMLPVGDMPLIEHVVREAASAGIEDVVIVSARWKEVMHAHFQPAPALDATLRARGKAALADSLREVERLARIHLAWQEEPLGLGHAVLQARAIVGDAEPFAVLLPDDLFLPRPGGPTATVQLVDAFRATGGGGALAAMEVSEEETARYGILAGSRDEAGPTAGLWRISDLVEKPRRGEAPTRMAVAGRYVLPGRTFEILARTAPGHGGEIQITDALRELARAGGFVGVALEARRLDAGTTLGWILANVEVALGRPDLAPALRAGLGELLATRGHA